MIASAYVRIDGVRLVRYYSTSFKKIKCVEDGNIYSLAYVTQDATVSFEETDIPLNEITAGAIVSADNVLGLSNYIVKTTEAQLSSVSADITTEVSSLVVDGLSDTMAEEISAAVIDGISAGFIDEISTAVIQQISSEVVVSADNVLGLSDYIMDTIDSLDGVVDNQISVDLGGA